MFQRKCKTVLNIFESGCKYLKINNKAKLISISLDFLLWLGSLLFFVIILVFLKVSLVIILIIFIVVVIIVIILSLFLSWTLEPFLFVRLEISFFVLIIDDISLNIIFFLLIIIFIIILRFFGNLIPFSIF